MAQEVLTHLKEHPDAWTRVDTILEFSQNMNTKVRNLYSAHGPVWWISVFHCGTWCSSTQYMMLHQLSYAEPNDRLTAGECSSECVVFGAGRYEV